MVQFILQNANNGFVGKNYSTIAYSGWQAARIYKSSTRSIPATEFKIYYSGVELSQNSYIQPLTDIMGNSTTYASITDSNGSTIGRVSTTNSRIATPDGNICNTVTATYNFYVDGQYTTKGDKLVATFAYITGQGGLITTEPLTTYATFGHGQFVNKTVRLTVVPINDTNKTRECTINII
jgi:Flp pilus assembly protein TadG